MNASPSAPAILAEVSRAGIATITLNRPRKSNAFDAAMRQQFTARLAAFAEDPAVRMLVLRAAGRHFCAGSDVSSFGEQPPEERIEMFLRLDGFPKPTLALVHGACLGAALALATCCDIVLAAPDAFFSIPEVRLGIAPLGLAPLFMRALGPAAFRRYALTGERFDAAQALRLGFVHELHRPDQFDQAAGRFADELLHGGPQAIAALKRTMRQLCMPDLASAMVELARRESRQMQGDEARAGVARFRAGQPPPWYPGTD